jgi:IS4 transposase
MSLIVATSITLLLNVTVQTASYSRLKNNTHIESVEERTVPEGNPVLVDARPYRLPADEDEAYAADGADTRFRGKSTLSDDQPLRPVFYEISETYCSRWVIETFFKWMNQHL